jgi:hypothetical protein
MNRGECREVHWRGKHKSMGILSVVSVQEAINILHSQETYIYFILYVNIQETLKTREVLAKTAQTDMKQLLQ